jgi:hypothetical protein
MNIIEKIDTLLIEGSFNTGDWVHQPQNEYENTYALVIGKTKRGKTEVIKIQDWRPIAAKTTLDNWYPQPKKIDPKKVPNKLKQKVEKKKQQLGISESILSEGKSWTDAARWVVKNKQMVYINPKTNDTSEDKKKGYIVLDAMTANMLTKILDNVSGDVKKKFSNLNLLQAVNIGWKMVK